MKIVQYQRQGSSDGRRPRRPGPRFRHLSQRGHPSYMAFVLGMQTSRIIPGVSGRKRGI